MKLHIPLAAAALCTVLGAGVVSGQANGYWRAADKTTASITGDIALSEKRVTINFEGFPLIEVRALKPEEISAVFDADLNAQGTGTLYRVNIPARQRFLHKNTLCGTEDTDWMATYVAQNQLRVAFFSDSEVPVMTFDAMQNSTSHCSTFNYVH